MTDKLHCDNFHAFDGTCCDTDQDCLCARPMTPRERPTLTISLLDVVLTCVGFWLGIAALAWFAFG